MTRKVKADLKKHWLSWTLLGIVIGLFAYVVKTGTVSFTGNTIVTLILVAVGSGLLYMGFNYLLKEYKKDTTRTHYTEEELNAIYNNNPTITITIPAVKLPKFRRGKKS